MPSDKQILANRANARRSTGPRTSAGKAASSRNALRHGLRAHALLLPGEKTRAFRHLLRAFLADYRPSGRLQEFLVEQMAVACWKLARLTRIEFHIFSHRSADDDLASQLRQLRKALLNRDDDESESESEPEAPPPPPSPDELIARAYLRDTAGPNTFARLSHYEMRLERSFYRAFRELRRLQTK